jgi:hypothetical protein
MKSLDRANNNNNSLVDYRNVSFSLKKCSLLIEIACGKLAGHLITGISVSCPVSTDSSLEMAIHPSFKSGYDSGVDNNDPSNSVLGSEEYSTSAVVSYEEKQSYLVSQWCESELFSGTFFRVDFIYLQ